ncbi:MAG: nitroreductase [Coriobacteriia bacterium]|nr:nitroreductase [Coriobacteriia bacterium]
MQVSHAIRERRSARAFLAETVDTETVGQILDLAKWAPSWANSQGWSVYVLSGEPLERLKAAIAKKVAAEDPPTPDIPSPTDWPAYLSERMVFRRPPAEAPGASDNAVSAASVWEFYGAPYVILLAVDEDLEPAYACFDAGLFAQTLCLAAEDRGFATCVMATAVRYGELLHAEIPEAEGKHFVVGIAFGLIDHTAVVNRSERNRVELDEFATFIDGSGAEE